MVPRREPYDGLRIGRPTTMPVRQAIRGRRNLVVWNVRRSLPVQWLCGLSWLRMSSVQTRGRLWSLSHPLQRMPRVRRVAIAVAWWPVATIYLIVHKIRKVVGGLWRWLRYGDRS
jgi:hypothetical protein